MRNDESAQPTLPEEERKCLVSVEEQEFYNQHGKRLMFTVTAECDVCGRSVGAEAQTALGSLDNTEALEAWAQQHSDWHYERGHQIDDEQ